MIKENKEMANMNAIYNHSWCSGYNLPLIIDTVYTSVYSKILMCIMSL